MKQFIAKIKEKQNLSFDESKAAFEILMEGKANDQEIFDFLTLLSAKGEASDEIAGGVYVLRAKSKRVNVENCVDTCGTGGDGMNTLNISTASALLLASMGVKVAKHGNKAVSSKSGSADFLSESGANINHEREKLISIFDKVGFVFLFAPLHHEAMKYVMPVRQKIAKKTIFNLLGPHTNPCSAKRQIIGVYDKELVKMFSNVAKNLDMEHVMIVHADDGLDEISICSETTISELKDNQINEYKISPKDFGLSISSFDKISANSSNESLFHVNNAFNGENSAVQDMIALNSGAALYLANVVGSMNDGIEMAFDLMNNGKAAQKLADYVRISNE